MGLPLIRFICLPDINRPIGGVKQLYRHCEHLVSLGFDACVVTENSNFRPSWFSSTASTVSLKECFSSALINCSNTILVIPETYVNVNLSSFYGFDLSEYPRVIFNQNAYYTFGPSRPDNYSLISQFYDSPKVLQIFSVSRDSEDFLLDHIGIPDRMHTRIVNAIEPIFSASSQKKKLITWMPRKNSDHSQAVVIGLQRQSSTLPPGWQLQALHELTHQQVADALNESSLFLSFGHPEGFGLPIAEAMAAGNWVVGYSGGGGKELFEFGASHDVSFGDWSGFTTAIKRCMQLCHINPRAFSSRAHLQSLAVKSLYSLQVERDTINNAWNNVLANFK